MLNKRVRQDAKALQRTGGKIFYSQGEHFPKEGPKEEKLEDSKDCQDEYLHQGSSRGVVMTTLLYMSLG